MMRRQRVIDESDEETVQRAWKAALFGLLLAPLLIYSAILLLKVCGRELSLHGDRTFHRAAILVSVMIVLYGCLFASLWNIGW